MSSIVQRAAAFAVGVLATAALVLGFAGAAGAADATPAEPDPVHMFAQAGIGFYELLHVEAGGFVGRHLIIEGMAAVDGVYGARWGGGATLMVGRAQGRRAPRHAFLVGARLMLNSDAAFDSHGDDFSSYGVLPFGYSFLSDGGFFFRASAGMALIRQRITHGAATDLVTISHEFAFGHPMIAISIGFACSVTRAAQELE